ncbi:MAG: N-acetylmuramoyl-L-alanine amidase [Clostridia bacterium]|nr:N-acetylmuramoyl-L-alanine amidase [Clostridia bacterium]
MKKYLLILWITVLAALILAAGIFALDRYVLPIADSILTEDGADVKEADEIFGETSTRPVIILDAGHGGEDSGAIGVDGVLEKDLNLSLTLRLRDLLIFEGWEVVLTRSDDRLLYNPETALSHKVQDLKTRLDYGARYPDAVFVSIHMNKFPAESCKGLQVYYSPNHASSVTLAERIQSDVKSYLSPDNRRLSKKATTSIFILNRIRIPAVLVECGFISNREEASLLSDDGYQKKLAAVLATSMYNEFCLSTAPNGASS